MQKVEMPTAGQISALERVMKGERLELFQSALDVLHDSKRAKDNPETAWRVDNLPYLYRGFERVNRESRSSRSRPAGIVSARVKSADAVLDLGLISVDVVTSAGVNYVIDAFQGAGGAAVTNLKYHASGTNSTAASTSNTSLGAEVGTRVAGTQVEGASANIYKTVATMTYGSSFSIVEWGLFSASSSGTLFDRIVFSAISVDSSTGIEFTFEWTLNAGG
jgi:hypothetical protein